jgi:hypothetical protein
MTAVRRVLAVLLITLFGLLAVSPALASDPESNLPACCRRAGKHRCMTAAGSGAASGATGGLAIQSGGTCPYFPGSLATASSPDAVGTFTAQAVSPAPACDAALRLTVHTSGLPSRHHSNQKRGPPSLHFIA